MTGRQVTPRMEWQRTEGFLLFSDITSRFLGSVAAQDVDLKVTAENLPKNASHTDLLRLAQTDPSVASLYVTAGHIADTVSSVAPNFDDGCSKNMFDRRHGVTRSDRESAKGYTYHEGFEDMDFPWHFSASVAHAAVTCFESVAVISKEQKDALNLNDWANVIGSGWFSELMHDLALTRNGIWQGLGKYVGDFTNERFRDHIRSRAQSMEEPLVYCEREEPEQQLIYATVRASKRTTKTLRDEMKQSVQGSVGCPVARKSVQVRTAELATNQHVVSLMKSGDLHVVPERSDDQTTRLVQDRTAIDKTLAFFALQLDKYQTTHGTPQVQEGKYGRINIVHEQLPPVEAFSWPTKERS